MSAEKKLDKRKDEIIGMLKKGVHKTSVARLVECGPNTLYLWLEANNLGAYIKSRKAKPAPKKNVVSGGKKRDDKRKR